MRIPFTLIFLAAISLSIEAFALPRCPASGPKHECTAEFPFEGGLIATFEMRDNKINGAVEASSPDGRGFSGVFKDGKYIGDSKITYASGAKYIGEVNNKLQPNGKGTLYNSDGKIQASGEWINGAPPTAAQNTNPPVVNKSSGGNGPTVVYQPDPDKFYSADSRNAGESGAVTVRLQISDAGLVEDVFLVSSSGYPRLDLSALEMAKEYKFKPYLHEGSPQKISTQLRIVFRSKK